MGYLSVAENIASVQSEIAKQLSGNTPDTEAFMHITRSAAQSSLLIEELTMGEEAPNINLQLYFRTRYEKVVGTTTSDDGWLTPALQRVLLNRLKLDRNDFEAGFSDCIDSFLCAEINDEDLPWDVNETE